MLFIDYIKIANNRHISTKEILEHNIGAKNIFLSAITKIELLYRAINKQDLFIIQKNLAPFNIYLINNTVTLKAITLIEKYSLSHKLSLPVSIIAATAIISDMPLFTYNLKDFKFIEELKLYTHYK